MTDINRDMIRRHILSKQCTLWGRNGDTTQQASLEALVDWQYDTIQELLALAEAEELDNPLSPKAQMKRFADKQNHTVHVVLDPKRDGFGIPFNTDRYDVV